jgi:hypothetical protein
MDVVEFGMTADVAPGPAAQDTSTFSFRNSTPSEDIPTYVPENRSREVHPEKALTPISTTEDGISTEEREVQPKNALSPMDVTEDGISTEWREVQPSKAPSPMDVTEDRIVTEKRTGHP